MRAFLLLALLCCAACPPSGSDCSQLVTVSGELASPIPGFPAVGQRLLHRVTAPLTSCSASTIPATVEVFGPGNLRGTGSVVSVSADPVRDVNLPPELIVPVALVEFTPTEPGTWTLKVAFEGLGVRNVTVEVLPSFSSGTPFSTPAGVECPYGPWVLPDETTALCEQLDASVARFTMSAASDAGVEVLPGTQVVVARDIVWMLSADGTSLERYQWRDGGLALTDAWADFSPVRIRGEHSPAQAIRVQRDGRVRLINLDSNIDTADTFSPSDVGNAIFSNEPALAPGSVRTDPSDFAIGLAALEPRARWGILQPGVGALVRRPVDPLVPGSIQVELPGGVVANSPLAPFERLPLWLRTDAGAVYFTVAPSGLSVSVFPNLPVVHATDRFVVLSDLDGGWRFQTLH